MRETDEHRLFRMAIAVQMAMATPALHRYGADEVMLRILSRMDGLTAEP